MSAWPKPVTTPSKNMMIMMTRLARFQSTLLMPLNTALKE